MLALAVSALIGAAAGALLARRYWPTDGESDDDSGYDLLDNIAGCAVRPATWSAEEYLRHELAARRKGGMPRHHPEMLTVDRDMYTAQQIEEIEKGLGSN